MYCAKNITLNIYNKLNIVADSVGGDGVCAFKAVLHRDKN